jgi:hypothetical protein
MPMGASGARWCRAWIRRFAGKHAESEAKYAEAAKALGITLTHKPQ